MNPAYYLRDSCRLCHSKSLELVLPLTPTALCDAYVKAGNLDNVQEVFPLDIYLCHDCGFAQIGCVVDPETIYRDYIYVTTSSMGLVDHFNKYAEDVMCKLQMPEESLVIDIGSNDGTLLKFFKKRGMRVLGVEPAREIAREASDSGIETIPDFFNSDLAAKIKNEKGPAMLIIVNNLFANIDDLDDITESVNKLLSPDGVFIIESSYLGDMINNTVFDFIYHEHLSYFSVKPLLKFFDRFSLELIDIQRVPTKGGSLRYYIQKKGGTGDVSSAVDEMIAYEDSIGLGNVEIYKVFYNKIESLKSQLRGQLLDIRAQGKTVAGYGGSATTTTLVYHFGIGEMMDYIVDDNPAKQDTFSPGLHIPVLPSEELYERRPDYVIILAWRYFEPIVKKHQKFLEHGGHFIVPLPELKVI